MGSKHLGTGDVQANQVHSAKRDQPGYGLQNISGNRRCSGKLGASLKRNQLDTGKKKNIPGKPEMFR
jgi:hypothetical protein